jgi:uncharacterized membrane protein SpoIIM required for sporulation
MADTGIIASIGVIGVFIVGVFGYLYLGNQNKGLDEMTNPQLHGGKRRRKTNKNKKNNKVTRHKI